MPLKFSFVIPVYNRPDEIDELLLSFTQLQTNIDFEIVIIEDGSDVDSRAVVDSYTSQLNINYIVKKNTGPGDSRNYGMKIASGNYFIILDSDCILPETYLTEVSSFLNEHYVDCFGGPDAAHHSFSHLQKAINFAMTSLISTGGIRGSKKSVNTFQPRSFNMGISKSAFLASKGFGNIHPGEDPDLSIRLWNLGFETALIPKATVYHKRRISWAKFYKQVHKFGLVRPILNLWHPSTKKITYWFPTVFVLGFIFALGLCLLLKINWLLWFYVIYFGCAFVFALISTKSMIVSVLAIAAIAIQFLGYGFGFLKSTFVINVMNRKPELFFPELFFKAE